MLDVRAAAGGADVEGSFYVFEETRRDSRLVAKRIDDIVPVRFSVRADGTYDVPAEQPYPALRSFPVFPNRDLKPGDRWEAFGHPRRGALSRREAHTGAHLRRVRVPGAGRARRSRPAAGDRALRAALQGRRRPSRRPPDPLDRRQPLRQDLLRRRGAAAGVRRDARRRGVRVRRTEVGRVQGVHTHLVRRRPRHGPRPDRGGREEGARARADARRRGAAGGSVWRPRCVRFRAGRRRDGRAVGTAPATPAAGGAGVAGEVAGSLSAARAQPGDRPASRSARPRPA